MTEPRAAFSACFGAPFLPQHPSVYANLLGEKLREHGAKVWLVNTGWSGGRYGVGSRMDLAHTRAMVDAALGGELDEAPVAVDPVFGLRVPKRVRGVPDGVLWPRATWADAGAYDAAAAELADMFRGNFRAFEGQVEGGVREAGPG